MGFFSKLFSKKRRATSESAAEGLRSEPQAGVLPEAAEESGAVIGLNGDEALSSEARVISEDLGGGDLVLTEAGSASDQVAPGGAGSQSGQAFEPDLSDESGQTEPLEQTEQFRQLSDLVAAQLDFEGLQADDLDLEDPDGFHQIDFSVKGGNTETNAADFEAKRKAFEEQIYSELDNLLFPSPEKSFLEDLGFKGQSGDINSEPLTFASSGAALAAIDAAGAVNTSQAANTAADDFDGPQPAAAGQEAQASGGSLASGKSSFVEDDFLNELDNLLDLSGPGLGPASGDQSAPVPPQRPLGVESGSSFGPGERTPERSQGDSDDAPHRWPSPPETDSELDQLRKLVMGRELSQLSFLTKLLLDPSQHAQALSQVITEAILLRSQRDDKLNTVLGPTVERIFTSSVRRNPETLANQIFPVIGPAIRRSISETFMGMLQDINSTLEMSLSLRGLKWRLEAMRVKKPFSEIVLLHTLLYHVEEIYLIHAASGLVLDHLVYEGGETRDADLVAGMFTAIQDFIKDSFSFGQGDNLDNLRFGERTIYLRRADQVYLACVVRGNPPNSLTQDLQEALELMVVDCADALDNFSGDVEPFKKARRFFEDFLNVRYQDTAKKPPLVIRLLPLAIIMIIGVAIGFSVFNNRTEAKFRAQTVVQEEKLVEAIVKANETDQENFNRALALLNNEPGLVVTRVEPESDGKTGVVVLRDSLARDPEQILAQEGALDPNRLRVISRPYVSLDSSIVQQRIQTIIDPLPTVNMEFDGERGLLTLTGSAPLGWILETREKALTIPGVLKLDASTLTDPRTMAMEALVESINGTVIHFPTNKDEPIPEDQPLLLDAVKRISELEKLAAEMQMNVSLIIYGHADATGQDRRNFELSEQRTKTVAAMLYARGSSIPIVNYGLGSQFSAKGEDDQPAGEDPESRKIELRVRLTQGGIGTREHGF
ncbi:MAG: OmpA family protein [Deltaproteobacteria bacterium]|jgi:OOP family OmpA-OmpF porin|nr:OmpA family protein [Deltaproteobacteria bacterium]